MSIKEKRELLLDHLITKIKFEISKYEVDSNGELLHKKYSQYGVGKYSTLEELMDLISVYKIYRNN